MIITAITEQKRRPNRVSVFIDGAFSFGMEAYDAKLVGLSEGEEITQKRLDFLINEVIFGKCRDTALRYLSYKPRTLKETLKRLKEDEYPMAVIKRVLILMVKYRYINDAKYAKDYAEERARAYYGIFRIKRELKMKGVKGETIDRVFSLMDFDETTAIIKFIERSRKAVSADTLLRRGFSYSDINKAFKIIKEQDEYNE